METNQNECPDMSESSLDNQRDDTTIAKFACTECSFTFATMKSFKIHKEKTHSEKAVSKSRPQSSEVSKSVYEQYQNNHDRLQAQNKKASRRYRLKHKRMQVWTPFQIEEFYYYFIVFCLEKSIF